ncbi:hypothetical protein HAX54_015292, partial [Datura stramonium]|nr:hypothetical protein [Datura stramonium]
MPRRIFSVRAARFAGEDEKKQRRLWLLLPSSAVEREKREEGGGATEVGGVIRVIRSERKNEEGSKVGVFAGWRREVIFQWWPEVFRRVAGVYGYTAARWSVLQWVVRRERRGEEKEVCSAGLLWFSGRKSEKRRGPAVQQRRERKGRGVRRLPFGALLPPAKRGGEGVKRQRR